MDPSVQKPSVQQQVDFLKDFKGNASRWHSVISAKKDTITEEIRFTKVDWSGRQVKGLRGNTSDIKAENVAKLITEFVEKHKDEIKPEDRDKLYNKANELSTKYNKHHKGGGKEEDSVANTKAAFTKLIDTLKPREPKLSESFRESSAKITHHLTGTDKLPGEQPKTVPSQKTGTALFMENARALRQERTKQAEKPTIQKKVEAKVTAASQNVEKKFTNFLSSTQNEMTLEKKERKAEKTAERNLKEAEKNINAEKNLEAEKNLNKPYNKKIPGCKQLSKNLDPSSKNTTFRGDTVLGAQVSKPPLDKVARGMCDIVRNLTVLYENKRTAYTDKAPESVLKGVFEEIGDMIAELNNVKYKAAPETAKLIKELEVAHKNVAVMTTGKGKVTIK